MTLLQYKSDSRRGAAISTPSLHLTYRKAVTVILGLLAVFTGLFGCNKGPKPTQHDLSEISAVSISCGHMDRSYGYAFRIHRDQDKWLFNAECFTHDHEVETVFENRDINGEEVDAMFEILKKNDSITYAENYKKPKDSPFVILDETTYGFCLTFSDGKQAVTIDRQRELEEFFYRIAEEYNE